MTASPPAVQVAESDLQDLRWRLRHTRWPPRWPLDGWTAGTDQDELARLTGYWADGYDWRKHEAAINALPWASAVVHGAEVPYLMFPGEGEGPVPIVLSNGWPSSFLELVPLARRLAAPSSLGMDGVSFSVVVPSLPGFTFAPQAGALPAEVPTHELWHGLMNDVLGFARYGAHGGDLGAGVTSLLGEAHPEAVLGIHLLAVADPPAYDSAGLTGEEWAYLAEVAAWFADDGGYEHQQMTRPLTLAYGLSDSPAGLLAWMVEKYRGWSDSGGDLSSRFTDDFLLTQASLYWFTNSISTSFRPYYEFHADPSARVQRVTVPTAVALFPKDLSHPPRSWAERTYNVTRYERMPRGGHFAAYEEPELLGADIAAFFADLS